MEECDLIHQRLPIPALQTQSPLGYRAQANFRREVFADSILAPYSFKARSRHNDGLDLAPLQFSQARICAPAPRPARWAGPVVQDLRLPAQTPRADPCPLRQILQRPVGQTHEHIPRIFPLGNCQQPQARGNFCGEIFHRMDCQINLLSEQRLLYLFHENAFSPDCLDRGVEEAVPAGLDSDGPDSDSRVSFFQLKLHPARLNQSQRTPARADANCFHLRSVSISVGRFPAACCVTLIAYTKSVIPACFKRESRRIRNWTPDKNIRG